MLGDYIRGLFKTGPTGETVQSGDIAYASDQLVLSSSFMQYNPDDLLTRKGYKVYKTMMTDEQVKAVVRFHRDSVTGREWSFADNELLSDTENANRRKVLTSIIHKMRGSFKSRLDMVMSSIQNGFSLTEKTFELVEIEGKSWVGIKRLALKPFDTFYFNQDAFGNLDTVEQHIGGNRTKLDITKFIHHVQNADVHEHYGQSELREAYRAWWSKDTTLLLQNIYLERAAAGFIYAQPTGGATFTSTSKEYLGLKNVLRTIRSNSAVILPSNIELTVEHPNDTEAFGRAIQGHDKSIAKSLLMPNLLGLSEQGPNGSRALGDTQLEAFLWMLDAESTALSETLNEQLFQDLATQNFPDGLFPPFILHELSDKKMMEILGKWNDLVTGNAVKPTSTDEQHIRSALKFPVKDPDDENEQIPVNPMTALTGHQVRSMMEIIDNVAQEKIPRDTGIQILLNAFPVNLENAELIMGEVGKSFEPKEALPAPQQGPEDEDEEDPNEQIPDETIAAKGGSETIEAKLTAARNRVAFAVIDAKATSIQDEAVDALSTVVLAAVIPVVADISETMVPQDVKGAKFNGRDVNKIRKQGKNMLTASWQLGIRHAKDEISKAAGRIMSASFARLDTEAAEFFDNRSFTMTGKLTADMLAIVQNTLSNAIKTSATRADTVDEIYEQFASQGFITAAHAQSQMQGILQSKESATARLNTVVRTTSFEAINEARYSYFTDPELSGFVEALEYTAILDSRTTQICRHLDGQIHAAEGGVWDGPYRPPNHFNCRSLLIPVTQFDKWSESALPELQPQAGFG